MKSETPQPAAAKPERLMISFGALSPPLAEQLDCKPSDVEMWQKDADAITRLLVRGLLADSVGRKCRQKLMNIIAKGRKS